MYLESKVANTVVYYDLRLSRCTHCECIDIGCDAYSYDIIVIASRMWIFFRI